MPCAPFSASTTATPRLRRLFLWQTPWAPWRLRIAAALLSLTTGAWAQSGSYDAFFTAIVRDNPAPLAALQARGFDLNSPDPTLQPPLVLALRRESWQVAHFLLDAPELDVNALNPAHENALMLAAIKGQVDLVKRLLQRQAQVNKPGWAPLHYAASHVGPASLPITRLLLDRYAYIDAASPNGTTPLMMAARYGQAAAVQLLLEEGADPLLKNQQGLTAADFARSADRADIVEAIAQAIRDRQPKGSW